MNRRELGLREFGRVTAGRGPVATGRVREVSPVLADGVERFIFADVFANSGLGAREREMITVAVLAAIGGAENQLGVHVPAALECGADPEELLQLCEQIAPYCGFPRALNASRAVRAVLEERGVAPPADTLELDLGDHVTLAVGTAGEGAGVLLVHSPETDRRVWRDVVGVLAAGSARVVAPDLRGLGSAVGAPLPADLGTLVTDLHTVLDEAEVSTARVVTLGAGAALGVALADAHPDRVDDLLLVAPCVGDVGARPGVEALTGLLTPATLATNPWGARYARDRLHRLDHEGWQGLMSALADAEVWVASRPTRVVDGAHGRHLTTREAEETWGVDVVDLFEHTSRLVPLEAHEQLAEVILTP